MMRQQARARWGWLLVLGLILSLPVLLPAWQLSELARYGPYMMLAASLAFVWGHCGLLSLGHAAFFGIGAYTMACLSLGPMVTLPGWVASLTGLILATSLAAVLAWLLAWLLFSGQGLQGAYFGIATLATAVLAERLVAHTPALGGANGLINVPGLNLAPIGPVELTEPWQRYACSMLALTMTVSLLIWLSRRPWGHILQAIREHEPRAQALGIDVAQAKRRAFGLSGGVAGLAGALFVTQFNFAAPALLGFALSTEAVIWVALGGRQSMTASCLGALLVRLLESLLNAWMGEGWSLVLGLFLVLAALALPRGLIGTWLMLKP